MKKKILIIGVGLEGVSVANYCNGGAQITFFDDKPRREIDPTLLKSIKAKDCKFFLGTKPPENLNFDLVVRSPGVRLDHPLIQKAQEAGAAQTTATKIFFENCPAKTIGVTGTKGKGTTSTLIYEMLKTELKDVYLAGNIGTPMLDILPKLHKKSIVVLELSSFQLADCKTSPNIAVVLMITTEHLDWHKDTNEYRDAKSSIVRFQTKDDFAVINSDFEVSRSFRNLTRAKVYFFSTQNAANGVFLKGSKIVSQIAGLEEITDRNEILLPGKHNLQNVAAATTVAKILGIRNENIKKVLTSFKGLAHRLQLVKAIKGVKFYNDSFSTTPETTIAAIEAFTNPKILILGGSSKNSNFDALGAKIVSDTSIKAIIVIGQEAQRILAAITKAGQFLGKIKKGMTNIESIVQEAYEISSPGDVIILSPACASFDMFKNYKDRGEQFTRAVRSLRSKI